MVLPRLQYEEREFGIPQDIYHSGLKKTYKKWVGRGRKSLAEHLRRKGEASSKQLESLVLSGTGTGSGGVDNSRLLVDLMRDAKSRGATTVSTSRGAREFVSGQSGNYVTQTKMLGPRFGETSAPAVGAQVGVSLPEVVKTKKALPGIQTNSPNKKSLLNTTKPGKKVALLFKSKTRGVSTSSKRNYNIINNARKNGDYIIFHDTRVVGPTAQGKFGIVGKNANADLYSHEVGHIINEEKAVHSPVQRLINRLSRDPKTRNNLNKESVAPAKTIGDTINRAIHNTGVVIEEAQASRNGISLMRKYGATPEEIKQAREHLGNAGDTYRLYRNRDFWNSLGNTIQIPSRRI